MLQHKEVSFEMLASIFPEIFILYLEFSQRIKIEGEFFLISEHGKCESVHVFIKCCLVEYSNEQQYKQTRG